MIYVDNAATTLPKPPAVSQAVVKAMASFGGAGRGSHPAALAASRCIYAARSAVGQLFGASPERVAFTSNATESLNIAIQGLLGSGDHVITTALEHNSVLRPLYRLESRGMELSIVGCDDRGKLDYDGFGRSLCSNTKAIVCTHGSNLTGELIDLAFIGRFCRDNGLLWILDVAQTGGVFPVDMASMGIDVLCFTGHKGLLGPQGTGGICLGEGIAIPPFKVGGSGQHSFDIAHFTQGIHNGRGDKIGSLIQSLNHRLH